MIHARAEVARSTNSAAEENSNQVVPEYFVDCVYTASDIVLQYIHSQC